MLHNFNHQYLSYKLTLLKLILDITVLKNTFILYDIINILILLLQFYNTNERNFMISI